MPPRRRPSEGRRVIFPSLHRTAAPREDSVQTKPAASISPSTSTQSIRTHTPPPLDGEILVHLGYSPAPLSTSHISPNGPIERSKIERPNSLDNLLNALPKLSLTNEKQTNIQTRAPVGNRNIFTLSRLQSKRLAAPQSAEPKFIFPEQKTIAPLTTTHPSLIDEGGTKLLSESKCKPLKSILKSKSGGRSSPSNISSAASSTTDEDVMLSTPQESQNEMHLSPDMPTLASPTSIRNLSTSSMKSHDSNDTLSESEVLERISQIPKLLPKSSTTLKRNQSDDAVGRNEMGERQRLRKLSEGSDSDSKRHQRPSDRKSSCDSCVSRHASFEDVTVSKTIGFDPRVLIHEYIPQLTVDELWFTEDELTDFKQEAIQRVRERYSLNVLPTGTGRVVVPSAPSSTSDDGQQISRPETVRFNHPALGCDDDCDTDGAEERLIQCAISREIRNILLVDVHEIFLALFIKSLKSLFPHISVTTARSGEEALTRVNAAQKAHPVRDGGSLHGFDIILVEERLGSLTAQRSGSSYSSSKQTAGDDSTQRRKITSGSDLIRSIVQEERDSIRSGESDRHALLIGVSARLAEDEDRLRRSGADVLWAKPPPAMDRSQRNHLLKVLMKKRGRDTSMFE